ncbi:MAG: hypothetical protein AAF639_41875 [Chloroflexota bacterium]
MTPTPIRIQMNGAAGPPPEDNNGVNNNTNNGANNNGGNIPNNQPVTYPTAAPFQADNGGAVVLSANQVSAPSELQADIPTRRSTPIPEFAENRPIPAEVIEAVAEVLAAEEKKAAEEIIEEEIIEEEEEPTETPTPTPTFTPTLGPPMVLLRAAETELFEKECTIVTWIVENVSEVYYQGLGVDGRGEREECVNRGDEKTVELIAILPSGNSIIETLTLEIIRPTPTPLPTATHTPIPIPTATWTPEVPTATPTPNIIYGVDFVSNGGNEYTCFIGQVCEINFTVSNRGNANDNLSISVARSGPWLPQLCRTDGVCANERLIINNIGPNNNAFVILRLDIPDTTSRQTVQYALFAVSDNSNGQTRSSDVVIEVEAK